MRIHYFDMCDSEEEKKYIFQMWKMKMAENILRNEDMARENDMACVVYGKKKGGGWCEFMWEG